MADVGSMFGGMFSSVLGGVVALVGILLVGGIIVGVAFYVRYIRQFNIVAEIISSRANIGGVEQYKVFFDKAGLIFDKKDRKYFFKIKDLAVELPAPPFNVLIPTDNGNMIKIWQKSAEEFVFLLPDKINQNIIVRQDGKEYNTSEVEAKQIDGDVAYWNVLSKRENKQLFNPESMLMKILPYLVPMLMFVLVIFMSWMVLKNFDVLKDVAASLKDTASILKQAPQATLNTVGA